MGVGAGLGERWVRGPTIQPNGRRQKSHLQFAAQDFVRLQQHAEFVGQIKTGLALAYLSTAQLTRVSAVN